VRSKNSKNSAQALSDFTTPLLQSTKVGHTLNHTTIMKLQIEQKTPLGVDDPLPSPNIHSGLPTGNNDRLGAQFWHGTLRIEGSSIKDEYGRHALLRGVNLTGNSKLPVTPLAAMQPGTNEFFDHRNVSFVGRPFTSKDAHEHFERLNKWGLTFTRLLVPWEALGIISLPKSMKGQEFTMKTTLIH
jgi:hypothetical protein